MEDYSKTELNAVSRDNTVRTELIETFFYTHLTCSGTKWANAYIKVHLTHERWISSVTELKCM